MTTVNDFPCGCIVENETMEKIYECQECKERRESRNTMLEYPDELLDHIIGKEKERRKAQVIHKVEEKQSIFDKIKNLWK